MEYIDLIKIKHPQNVWIDRVVDARVGYYKMETFVFSEEYLILKFFNLFNFRLNNIYILSLS
jgi:hypothetical protein